MMRASDRQVTRAEDRQPARCSTPSSRPTARKVAYVLDHDLFVYDLASNKETQITKGGTTQERTAWPSSSPRRKWAASAATGGRPTRKHIAYEEADHEGVEIWYVADPAKPGQAPLPQYYPRPGKKNVTVRLGIIPVDGRRNGVGGMGSQEVRISGGSGLGQAWAADDSGAGSQAAGVGAVVTSIRRPGNTNESLQETDGACVNIRFTNCHIGGTRSFLWLGESPPSAAAMHLGWTRELPISAIQRVRRKTTIHPTLRLPSFNRLSAFGSRTCTFLPTRIRRTPHDLRSH